MSALLLAEQVVRADFGVTLVLLVVAFVLSVLLAPKPALENAKPAGIGAFDFPTATEGRPVPLVWGEVKIGGPNIGWYGDFRQEAITQTVKTGMFSSAEQTIGFEYFVGLQFALCVGRIDFVTKVWVGDKLVWSGEAGHNDVIDIDEPDFYGGKDLGGGGIGARLRVHAGGFAQAPSDYLSDFLEISGKTPAYRGFAYLAPDEDPIYVGDQPRLDPWAFAVRRIPTGPAIGADAEIGNTNKDANPVNVLYEILTDKHWGLREDPATVDAVNFAEVGGVLADEDNGVSLIIDSATEVGDLIRLIEDQINGKLYQDHEDGLWKIKLIRDDYVVDDLVTITNPGDVIEVSNFARGSWAGTSNEVRAEFTKRAAGFTTSFAPAQDMANMRLQNSAVVQRSIRYPGVARRSVANALAWRELRLLSFPLAKCSVVVDRSYTAGTKKIVVGSAVRYVDETLEAEIIMRVINIDSGDLLDGRVTLDLVQDVFQFGAGHFADSPDTAWEEPADDLQPFPTDEQVAFEVPRGIELRDPVGSGVPQDRVWCMARRQGAEASFKVVARNHPTTPAGAFVEVGESFGFVLIGELKVDLDAGSAVPLTSLLLVADPDSQVRLEEVFDDTVTAQQVGVDLRHLLLVDDEFMAPRSAQLSGADVQISNVYRGLLDSTQADHAAGAKVYLMFRGGVPAGPFPAGDEVELKLLPRSQSDLVAEGDATTIALTMDDRIRRPAPPSRVSINGTPYAATPSLEGTGSGAEGVGMTFLLVRRDYRAAQDEVVALTVDAETLFPDYPAANTTEHQVEVRDDPGGANTLLLTLPWQAGASFTALRIDILIATGGALPTSLGVVATARHVHDGTTYTSRQDLAYAFAPTSGLTGQHALGALDTSDVSTLYTATEAGTYAFTLSSAFSAGAVEYRLNGGSWTSLIAAGMTSGSIVGVSISDTIEVRHGSSDVGAKKQLDMTAPTVGQDAFAVLYT